MDLQTLLAGRELQQKGLLCAPAREAKAAPTTLLLLPGNVHFAQKCAPREVSSAADFWKSNRVFLGIVPSLVLRSHEIPQHYKNCT